MGERTYGLNVNGWEQVLKHGRHKLELFVFASESRQDELRERNGVERRLRRRRGQEEKEKKVKQRQVIVSSIFISPSPTSDPQPRKNDKLTSGPSANSLPILLGLLAILNTSLAKLYLNTLKLNVGPLGNLINLRFKVVVPSIKERSARSSAFSVLLEREEAMGRSWFAGWEKTSRWVTPRGPDMET